MRSSARFTERRRRERGFTLIELLVGLTIGLFVTLMITYVLLYAEDNKRRTVTGSDAQTNGAIAMARIERELKQAGYGFTNAPPAVGCNLSARYNGAAVAFPSRLVPLEITPGSGGAPDTLRIFASGKSTYSVPVRVVDPGYDPATANRFSFPAGAVLGFQGPRLDASGNRIAAGDLVVVADAAGTDCEVFEVTADPTGMAVPRDDVMGRWNSGNNPSRAYGNGSFLMNLGAPVDLSYGVTGLGMTVTQLAINAANSQPEYVGPALAFPNVVQFKAYYGKDTGTDGVVDQWDKVAPVTADAWRRVLAVRIALVARGSQYEKEEITTTPPLWDVGTAVAPADATECGTSKCVSLPLDHVPDWKHYRYKVFDTMVPLRNAVWALP